VYLILFLGFHTGPSTDSLFISLGIPARSAVGSKSSSVRRFVHSVRYGLSRLSRSTGWRKLIPSLTLFFFAVLWFCCGGNFVDKGALDSADDTVRRLAIMQLGAVFLD